ncbi:MAG: hypothetical protein EA393_09325 [Bacteroidetes bacterium]|nr:MAG: hypothetical protein EA393_09325 [Bacteroidota bacterium]
MFKGFKYFLLFVGFISLTSGNCPLQANPVKSDAQKAMITLYNFQFQVSDSIIRRMEKNFPEHYMSHLMRAQYYWWQIISNDLDLLQQKNYQASLVKAESLAKELVKTKNYNYNDVFQFINLYALKARIELMNSEYLRALRHMRNCTDYLELSLGRENIHPDFYLTSGLYNYMADYGSRRYPFLMVYALFYPRGDMQKGLEQLKAATHSNNIVIKTEAHYFLMKIFLELEQDFSQALQHAAWLVGEYPENLIYLFHYHEILLLLEKNELAVEIRKDFLELLNNNKQLSFSQRKYFQALL